MYGKINSQQIKLLHARKREKGLDEELYRALLATHGVTTCKDLTQEQLDRILEHLGPSKHRRPHSSAKKSGMHLPPAKEKEAQLKKIGALLADMKLHWAYADGVARQMYRVEKVKWCNRKQLGSVIAALANKQAKQKGEPK